MRQRLASLYEGLQHFLRGDDLWHALCIWQDNYAQASTFELKEYLNQINPLLPDDVPRSQIHRKLVQSLLINGRAAHFDPLPTMNEFRVEHGLEVPTVQQEVAIPGHIESFIRFYLDICRELSPELRERLQNKLVWLAEQSWLSDEFQHYLQTAHQDIPVQTYITDEPDGLPPLMDACYELLCEWVGPVEADQRFSKALTSGTHTGKFRLEQLI